MKSTPSIGPNYGYALEKFENAVRGLDAPTKRSPQEILRDVWTSNLHRLLGDTQEIPLPSGVEDKLRQLEAALYDYSAAAPLTPTDEEAERWFESIRSMKRWVEEEYERTSPNGL